ncbi:hypothetical protein [Listeria rustica]|uniref:Uncharacterized protein n=1 Tax=Listeria rustica TaxID=2713503 RepID=A0A7W1T6T8_9LIST|nr:hypothetical protein [Listeria rustica]MBA3926561.1 hypothetical protein [Listeria rustica]
MKWRPFNINHNVKVKLTRVGIQRYKDWMNRYIPVKDSHLRIERPTRDDSRLYQFNKRKMESFIYDYYEWGGVAV